MTSQVAPTRADVSGEVTPRAGTGECLVAACPRPGTGSGAAKGFCGKHYARYKRWGDPLGSRKLKGCGTPAGYHYHRSHGTVPCKPCVASFRSYSSDKQAERRRRDEEARERLEVEIAAIRERLGDYQLTGRPSKATLARPRHDDIWKDEGRCNVVGADPAWFVDPQDDATVRRALNLCGSCRVVELCRVERARLRAPGVWGGQYWVPSVSGVRLDERFL